MVCLGGQEMSYRTRYFLFLFDLWYYTGKIKVWYNNNLHVIKALVFAFMFAGLLYFVLRFIGWVIK